MMWALLWQWYLQGVAIGLCLFILYLELRPDLGGLFLRPGQKGETVFAWGGFWQLWRDLLPRRGGGPLTAARVGLGGDRIEGGHSPPETGLPLWSREYLDMNPLVIPHVVALLYLGLAVATHLVPVGGVWDFFPPYRVGEA